MDSYSTQNERKQLEEDIQRIKSALQDSGGDWQLSLGPGVGESEDDEDENDDSLQIVVPNWDSGPGEGSGASLAKALPSKEKKPKKLSRGPVEDDTVSVADSMSQGSLELTQMGVALNKAYQEIIVENLEVIQEMLTQNKEHQEKVQKLIEEDMATRGAKASKPRKRAPNCFGYPYFRDKNGLPPPMNYDARCKKSNDEIGASLRPAKNWSEKEKKILIEAVNADILKQKIQPFMNRKELDLEKLVAAKANNNAADEAVILERIVHHQQMISLLMDKPNTIDDDMSDSDVLLDNIDWMKISAIDFDGQRRSDECYIYWRNTLHPSISNESWSPVEDESLVAQVEAHGGRDWESIAKDLGTSRSAFQCLQRFQMKLNPCLKTGKWSEAEDAFLKEVVQSVTVDDTIPWDQVSYYLEGRSNEQCEQRYQQLQNIVRTGRWTEEEDKLLQIAVARCGRDWTKVQELVPLRTGQQCRERFMNTLQRDNKCGFWRYMEDKTLWLLKQELVEDGKWSMIAGEIPGRTDNGCLQRYKVLHRYQQIEDILLTYQNGKITVDELLRRGPIRNNNRMVKGSVKNQRAGALGKKLVKAKAQLAKVEDTHQVAVLDPGVRRRRNAKYYEEKVSACKARVEHIENLLAEVHGRTATNMAYDILPNDLIKMDIEQCFKDRENGIYVPRPLLGVRGVKPSFFDVGNRSRLKVFIKRRTARILNPLSIEPKKHKRGSVAIKHEESEEDQEEEEEEEGEEEKELESLPPVKKQQRKRKANVAGKTMTLKVEEEIHDLVQDYKGTKTSGRRRLLAGDCGRNTMVEETIQRMFFNALMLDQAGCKKSGDKLLLENQYDPANKDSGVLFSDLHILQSVYDMKYDFSDSKPTGPDMQPNTTLSMLPRSAKLNAQGGVIPYSLPPLPPTVSTMLGFKTLLLKRRKLIELSNKRHSLQKQKAKENEVKKKRKRLSKGGVFPGMTQSESEPGESASEGASFISHMKRAASVVTGARGDVPTGAVRTLPNGDNSDVNSSVVNDESCTVSDSDIAGSVVADTNDDEATTTAANALNGEASVGVAPSSTPARLSQSNLFHSSPAFKPPTQSILPKETNASVNQSNMESKPRVESLHPKSPVTMAKVLSTRPTVDSEPKTRVMVFQGSDLSPMALTDLLKTQGVITDPQKVKMQLLNRADLAKRVLNKTGEVEENMGAKVQTKTKKKKVPTATLR